MELINKVAESGIITIDLEQYFPLKNIVELDIKQFLFKEIIVKEIEFRANLKTHNWQLYTQKTVAVFCSSDAILPQWCFMLMANYLIQQTNHFYFGTKEKLEQKLLLENIKKIEGTQYLDQKVVIKGCGTQPINSEAYLEISKILLPKVKSLMFGEPCSTVPIYKKKTI